MAQKIITGLFLLSLLTFPFGQIFRLQLSGNINVTVFDITVLLAAIIWLITTATGERQYVKYKLTIPILLFLLTIILSLFANLFRYSLHEVFVAALYGMRFLLFTCVYFIVKEREPDLKKKLPYLITITGAIVVLLGYLQFFLYPNLRNLYYLGWDEHLVRMFSSFLDPNFAGAFFVLYFFFLLGQVKKIFTLKKSQHEKSGSSRLTVSPLMRKVLLMIIAFSTFIAIFLTTSRSAFLMLVVGLITYVLLIGQKKWLYVFFATVTVIFLFGQRFFFIENVNPFRVASSVARIESAQNAAEIIAKNTLFGVGFNAYRYAQYEYGFRQQNSNYPSHADSGTDNSFLFVFATTGIIGLVAYIHLLVSIFQLGWQKKHAVIGVVLVASLAGLCVNSLFINSLFYPAIMYWLWVLAGLTDN